MVAEKELRQLALKRQFLQVRSDVLRLTLVQQSRSLEPAISWGEKGYNLVRRFGAGLTIAGSLTALFLLRKRRALNRLIGSAALLLSAYRKGRALAYRFRGR